MRHIRKLQHEFGMLRIFRWSPNHKLVKHFAGIFYNKPYGFILPDVQPGGLKAKVISHADRYGTADLFGLPGYAPGFLISLGILLMLMGLGMHGHVRWMLRVVGLHGPDT